MFTGIIEEIGTVKSVISGRTSGVIVIKADTVLNGTKLGDSIAVNGVCLTVTNITGGAFSADVMPETLSRSNLGLLQTGGAVNLERAMAADGRFGGHIVSGHIDGVGTITEMKKEENAVWVTIAADEDIMRLIVEKGSAAIDGISLTVAKVNKQSFSVSIIPHTGSETALLHKKIGDKVNLENDIIGKYVEKLLNPTERSEKPKSKITMEFLRENGF